MEFVDRLLLLVHIVAGFGSLTVFFVPAFARKGGELHNRAGRWYVRGMWTVVVTAVGLSVINYLQGMPAFALFLGFLAFLTARPLYYGVAVIKHKRLPTAKMRQIDTALAAVLALGGPYLIGMGLGFWGPQGQPAATVFGVLGLLNSWPFFLRRWTGREKAYSWLHLHIEGLVITAIAAFTAFFVFGGARLFGHLFAGPVAIAVWSAPTVLGLAFSRYYKGKIGRKQTVAA